MNKHLLLIMTLIGMLTFAFADTDADSLKSPIRSDKGVKMIEARLEKAFRARVSNFIIARNEAILALEEIRRLGKHKDLEALAYYYLGSAYYYYSETDSALYYFNLTEEIAKDINNDRLLGLTYNLMGSLYNSYYGNQTRAIDYYNKSIHYSLLAGNLRGLGAVYSELANLLRSNGGYEKALEYIFMAREYYRKAEYSEGEAWVLYVIGSIYGSCRMYEEAMDAYTESLDIYRELAENDGIYGGVAICLDQMASVSLKLNNLAKAREYNNEALEIHKKGDSRYGYSTSLKYRADIEYMDGNYPKALSILDSSLTIKKAISNITGFASVYELFGLIYIVLGNDEQAMDSLKIGLKYAQKNNQLRHIADIYGHMSEIYYARGKYDEAYRLKSSQVAISDSIYNTSSTRKLLQSEALLQIEDQEKQIRELEHENRLRELSLAREVYIRRYLTGIVLLSLVILGMFIYLYFITRKAHKNLLESKKRVDELNATKDKFFSIIAHDLRSPFNSILGFSTLLKQRQRSLSPEETETMITAINESAQNSYKLLDNLLEWARSQSGTIPYNPQDISLKENVHEVLGLLMPQSKEKNIGLEYDSDDYVLKADKNMLNTILRNLISNAIKYSYPGGKVCIHAREEGEKIQIRVSDSGIGIPEAVQKDLFSVSDNYRIAGTAGEKGSGLGLVICKEFVEKHGGSIGLESIPTQGSTFYFTINRA
ncbi:MAG: tetratricopeptide repeat protein [Candidatus Neomarinimicrobiota bacterium]|jgi:signal transduction histidine kinase|nr:tetratricopeptide repeat protein [Candidatus Neomarinimicrobiota bacterium]